MGLVPGDLHDQDFLTLHNQSGAFVHEEQANSQIVLVNGHVIALHNDLVFCGRANLHVRSFLQADACAARNLKRRVAVGEQTFRSNSGKSIFLI